MRNIWLMLALTTAASAWGQVWNPPVTSGGTVTSVTGTTNQIDVATGTTTPVISLDPNLVLPAPAVSQVTTSLQTASNGAPGCEIQGDSYMVGNGPLNAAGLGDANLIWANLIKPYLALFCENKAVGGDTAMDIDNNEVMFTNNQPTTGWLYLMNSGGANDTQAGGSGANYQLVAQRAVQNDIFWNITANANKNLLQGATMAGGFAVSSTYRAGQGIKSTTNGATASQAITVNAGGVIEFCHMVLNGNTGQFTVKVDGVTQTDPVSASTTWISGGDGGQAISTSNGTTQFCAGDRLTGFSAGSHTVLFTQTAAGTVDIEALWSPSTVGNATILMMDVPQLGSAITNFASTGLYQTILTNAEALAQSDTGTGNPYNIGARALLGANNGTGNFASDQIHPSKVGETVILGSTSIATSALYVANTAGLVTNVPYLYNSVSAQYGVPATLDIARGFSIDPENNVFGGSVTAFAGLQTLMYAKGAATFEFDSSTVPTGTRHVFGGYGAMGYSFCNWPVPTGQANTTITMSAWTSCPIDVNSAGNLNLGVATTGNAAVILSPTAISIGFTAGNVNVTQNGDNAAVGYAFQPKSTATAGTNFGSAFLGFTANDWNGAAGAVTDKFNLQVAAGTNAGVTLKLVTSGSTTPAFNNIDVTAATNFLSAPITAPLYSTTTNCASGASPAVCSAAPAGAVAMPTGTNPTLVVNTTAVTANSRILLEVDDSVTIGGTTCNSTLATLVGGIAVTARTAATSFTISYNGTIAVNPLCISYLIMN